MTNIYLPKTQVEIALSPVLRSEFYRNGTNRIAAANKNATPVTNVSASEAAAYARALGGRLPRFDEFAEFLDAMKPKAHKFKPSVHLEWLDCSPDWEKNQKMNCIIAIDNESNATVFRGSLQDRPYSSVMFRIARPR